MPRSSCKPVESNLASILISCLGLKKEFIESFKGRSMMIIDNDKNRVLARLRGAMAYWVNDGEEVEFCLKVHSYHFRY